MKGAGNMRQSQETRSPFDLARISQEGYRSGGFRSINEEIRPDLRGNPDLAGVGIFFQQSTKASFAYVQSIIHGSSADRCGLIQHGDQLVAVAEAGEWPRNVEGQNLHMIRDKILGKQGSFVRLQMRRPSTNEVYEVELMRGSPEFIEIMHVSSDLKEKQISSNARIQELESQVAMLRMHSDRLQAHAQTVQVEEDPRIGPLEEELSARMEDLRRFEEMLLASKEKTREAILARDKFAEQLKDVKSDFDLLKEKLSLSKEEESRLVHENESLKGQISLLKVVASFFRSMRCKFSMQSYRIEVLRSELQSIKERDAKLGQRLTSGHRAIAQHSEHSTKMADNEPTRQKLYSTSSSAASSENKLQYFA
ncbi:hypothetical protein GUITHDRAFT_133632 [Guillardia theta CCMP2712]|uniref:PDZ domain-containing protein n=1 Tax=Guillardia theta (strain CCMP2712) TaxID=905079 RepID=L1JWS9_GUITC|nr:hypothetical protein GUITHDRAFT_133632 [Guillardia theta CCMP2712]EKX52568.1 hypothetical protein GUITHDRAFT_133632 [Guillardia theta CCMP2712]|eukprot:XP_005839548.1 hypothetical protein GUITHDRAFT_133632 [Guillardia theta CCMP2712]